MLGKFLSSCTIGSFSRRAQLDEWVNFSGNFNAPDNVQIGWNLSELQSELLYDWRFIANQFVLVTNPLRLTTSNFIFQLNTCGYSPYVTSSLTREWVCHLQLLLVLASAVTLRPESRWTHNHILLYHNRDYPNLGARFRVYIPQE
jgi:hypothetical protein